MKKIASLISRLLCSHRHLEFMRNLHGDEINRHGGKRSIWRCLGCQTCVAQNTLHDNAIADMRHAQTLQSTLDRISTLKVDENYERMVMLANKIYADFCLKEMHLARLEGRLIGERGVITHGSLSDIESFVTRMEEKITHLNHQINNFYGASARIQECAKRLGVV